MRKQKIRTNADGEIEHYYEDLGPSTGHMAGGLVVSTASAMTDPQANVEASGLKRPSGPATHEAGSLVWGRQPIIWGGR